MTDCSCGYKYDVCGQAHCCLHHRTYPLLNDGSGCPECKSVLFSEVMKEFADGIVKEIRK